MIKKQTIINSEVNYMLSSMGHTDIVMVTDAGFPIPKDAWLVDLSITRNLPDLATVLKIVGENFIAEKIIYADYIPQHNLTLHKELKKIFFDCDHELLPHEKMMTEVRDSAKGFIRTGGYCPWGNIALVSGVDLSEWFTDPGTSMPGVYQERFDQVEQANKDDKK